MEQLVKFCLHFYILFFVVLFQPLLLSAQQTSPYVGLDEQQLVARLGSPDKASTSDRGLRTFSYGSGAVFLRDGKVVGTSASSALQARELVRRRQGVPENKGSKTDELWVNDWTPVHGVTTEEALEVLLSK